VTLMATRLSFPEISANAQRLYQAGNYAAAAKAFEEAAEVAAQDLGDELASAEMKNNQSVALLRAKQAQAALEATLGTEGIFAKANDLRREGMALGNQASALEALGRRKEAVQGYQRAAAILERAGEGDLRAEIMQLLAVHYLRRAKFIDAVITLQSGLAGVKNPTAKQRLMKKFLFIRL
jgi:tetratricopeptide (TPR) repeat protein